MDSNIITQRLSTMYPKKTPATLSIDEGRFKTCDQISSIPRLLAYFDVKYVGVLPSEQPPLYLKAGNCTSLNQILIASGLKPSGEQQSTGEIAWRPSWNSLAYDCNVVSSKLQKLWEGHPIVTISAYPPVTFQMQLYAWEKDKFVSGQLLKGSFEKDKVIRTILQVRKHPGAFILDIGANIGTYTTVLAKHFPDRHVFAFEPQRGNAAHFCRSMTMPENNFNLNKVTFFPYGLGSTTDLSAHYKMHPKPDNQAWIWIEPSKSSAEGIINPVDATQDEIGIVAMDDLLDDVFKTRFPGKGHQVIIKIDVEGYECNVLGGMEAFLDFYQVMFVAMEWLWVYKNGCGPRIIKLFENHGLVPYAVGGEKSLVGIPMSQWDVDIELIVHKME
eukprot:GHVU01057356.1.p1 GENE.GHVU01057356.1~~GHVU01057356.1.p1  ORF type:complete len:448 (-),score=45.46 GHVU01057356.1:266-1426(-)